ncbi:MAG: hypothetical protein IGR93_04940 [Hydrococcus sp. C42_A2020_068]|uniref:CRISPR-associated protein Csx18 n=1 Tax=Pleurocapsa sp. PCC 7327 TaxID=118163 RepID=UPI00029F852A|nr:CRISPR-associated protein Csx18 [Pleurocapsa sp. PCC 7327]AFY77565.1 hypothetical protein Ple7327_2251 [Pleurocapsa sp. PCC 7327]MBF2019462.1 hypothetical protein [Hydrococcus sp. C42_A2020_068]
MYLSLRATFVRNVVVAGVNGAITLILLLIAPLGLAAVIVNTVMVTASTFVVCTLGDLVVAWLLKSSSPNQLTRGGELRQFNPFSQPKAIDRRKRY